MRRYLTKRLRDPGGDRAQCSAPLPPPVVGSGDDDDVDWVARGPSSSGGGSIVALALRWSLESLSPSGGGGGGGGREARGIPGRGEEDEYRGRKVQGGVDEAQRGREEEEGSSVGGWATGPGGGGTGRPRCECPPVAFRVGGGLSSRHLSIVVYP